MMGGAGFGMFGLGALIMIAFWVLVIGGVVWLVVTLVRGGQGQATPPVQTVGAVQDQTPLDILKARYARGEITKEQFEEMKRGLGV